MRRKVSILILLIIVLSCFSACGEKSQKRRFDSPVTEITCISPETMPTLQSTADGNIIACWSNYDEMVTYIRVVDIAKNSVITSLDLTGCYDLFPESFTDGSFVLRDSENGQWIFYSSELGELSRFQAENMDGFFSHDRSKYYYLKDRVLYCTDTAGGQSKPMNLEYNLRFNQITGFHPTKNIIALHMFISPFSTECGTAILDLDNGTFPMIQDTIYQASFGEQSVTLAHFDDNAMQYELTYCENDTAKYISASQFSEDDEIVLVKGSDYLIGISDSTDLYRLKGTVASCSLNDYGMAGGFRDACWIERDCLLVGCVWQNFAAKIYVVCPELLTFQEDIESQSAASALTADESISKNYWGKLSGEFVAENMKELRTLADKLEQTYDVNILLSDQCEEMASYCSFTLELTDTMTESEEIKCIRDFLQALEKSLSLYPDGFFKQFRNSVGEGGICFLPVKNIISDIGAVGVCYEGSNWHAIAMDTRVEGMVGYICHEIWHATENKIISDDYSAFSEEKWDVFNPKGFLYNDVREKPDTVPFRWTLYDEGGNVYFIDAYARTNSREDRARIMEYVMAQQNYHEQIKASSALMKKLRYMCDMVNKYFDTTGWNNVPWIEFLNTGN